MCSSACSSAWFRNTPLRTSDYLTYNLPDTDVSSYLSSFTVPLYGSDAVCTG
jgi:hypothetical protein